MGRFSRNRMPFRERLARFFYGRNGADSFCNFLSIVAMVIVLVAIFMPWMWLNLTLTVLALVLMIYSNFRMLSRNLYKRRQENAAFCRLIRDPVRKFFSLQKSKWRDRKTHIYRKCPKCKNVLRLPRTKGEHTVCCPCCKERFDLKVR